MSLTVDRAASSGRNHALILAPYRQQHRAVVQELLTGLSELYPGADAWLERRLAEARQDKARCTLGFIDRRMVGLAIETPKQQHVKLSTLYVHPAYRRYGVGRRLVHSCWNRWLNDCVSSAYVTVRNGREQPLRALLEPFGFKVVACVPNRYGVGQDEYVLRASLVR